MPQELGDNSDHQSLEEAGREKSASVAVSADHVRDERNEKGSAATEAGSNNPRSQTAPVGEPFERGADRAAIDECRADSCQSVEQIELRK